MDRKKDNCHRKFLVGGGQTIFGVVAKVQDCGLKVIEFELESHYYLHFGPIFFGKERIALYAPPQPAIG